MVLPITCVDGNGATRTAVSSLDICLAGGGGGIGGMRLLGGGEIGWRCASVIYLQFVCYGCINAIAFSESGLQARTATLGLGHNCVGVNLHLVTKIAVTN